ncbi:hypothetical protein IE53DRAFT_381930, partial [Violaceomyces palustris]
MTTTNKPNLDGILLLEQPLVRVPLDQLRRQQRNQQRLMERELNFCTNTLNDLENKWRRDPSSPPSHLGDGFDRTSSNTPTPIPTPLVAWTNLESGQISNLVGERFSTGGGGGGGGEADPIDLEAVPSSGACSEIERGLDAMIGRLRGLKRKLTPLAEQSKHTLRMAQSRVDHLSSLHSIQDCSSPEFVEWSKTRLDRMLTDYMLRRGYRSSAEALARSKGIEDLVDSQLFSEISRIEDSLVPPPSTTTEDLRTNPSCTAALAWCSENKTWLRKIKSPLEFELRLQEYIELARIRTPESIKEAILYSRKHLLPLLTNTSSSAVASAASGNGRQEKKPSSATAAPVDEKKEDKEEEYDRLAQEAIRKQVHRAMGLLACGPGGWAYEDLYNPARWLSLKQSFRSCALQIHSLPPQPIIHIALSAGLSSLKLPICYSQDRDEAKSEGLGRDEEGASQARIDRPNSNLNVDCPICDRKGLGLLANEVPWSHHSNSTLVCSLSGLIMDENNPPIALPNGRVYSQV